MLWVPRTTSKDTYFHVMLYSTKDARKAKRGSRKNIICSAECCFVARSLLGAFSKAKKLSLLTATALPKDSSCTEVFRALVKAFRNVFIINCYICSAAQPAFCRGKLYYNDMLQEKKCPFDHVVFKRQKDGLFS